MGSALVDYTWVCSNIRWAFKCSKSSVDVFVDRSSTAHLSDVHAFITHPRQAGILSTNDRAESDELCSTHTPSPPQYRSRDPQYRPPTLKTRTRHEVVVIGTGGGGAVIGAELAAAGFDVAFVESGRLHESNSFKAPPLETLEKPIGMVVSASRMVVQIFHYHRVKPLGVARPSILAPVFVSPSTCLGNYQQRIRVFPAQS